ncbi:SDR family NAD(P)-dependent oxidoreductase [Roseobacter weihaiensis]|uniref:SDR family NAD(P)-dependent oxidoreductase n=1 Tax=Roseobacter weihaiensis TaxID=2763262 RepID=UPI001D09D0B6|nr:SDR family NAD(P)-dependent oxidoreductase [Roseobacter sp. H9]
MELAGKHALVTGGGTGIGLAIARALAEAGVLVTITGRRQAVLDAVAAEVEGLFGLAMDVRDEADVIATFQRAVAARGPIQICIANAGIAEGRALHKTDLAFWRDIMATNLDGTFLTLREALRSMRRTDWGRVIAVSSVAGLRGLQGASCYTASKHGVVGLIRALSEDYLGRPYTFNALCPAYVDTEIVTRNTASISERAGVSAADAREMMTSANRHKRLIAPAEVAAAAMWLVSPGAESVNGQAIEIAGGMM